MKTQELENKNNKNVQKQKPEDKKPLMVLQKAEETTEVDPTAEKADHTKQAKIEEVKNVIASFQPSAEDRIKRAENFSILSGKYTHLKTKKDELEKFVLSSDGTKEKLVLENSTGQKFEVNNTTVLTKIKNLMNEELGQLLEAAELEVRTFEI